MDIRVIVGLNGWLEMIGGCVGPFSGVERNRMMVKEGFANGACDGCKFRSNSR